MGNPLLNIFTPEDIAKLESCRVLVTGSQSKADERVSISLTHDGYGNRKYQEDLACWFAVAEVKGYGDYFKDALTKRVNNLLQFDQCVGELAAGYFVYKRLDPSVEYRFREAGPDMLFASHGQRIQCEVKSAVGGLPPGRYCGAVAPRAPIVQSLLKQSDKQLKPGDANLVLIMDWYRPPITEHDMEQALHDRCRPNQMTRLSAVGVLRWSQDVYGWFTHNPYAKMPIHSDILEPWAQYMLAGNKFCWHRQTLSDPIPGITDCY